MSEPGPRFEVQGTALVKQFFKTIQTRASSPDKLMSLVSATKVLLQQLETQPTLLGEPLYRLKGIDGHVRVCFVPPLVAHFAVYEEKQFVLLTDVDLLSGFNP